MALKNAASVTANAEEFEERRPSVSVFMAIRLSVGPQVTVSHYLTDVD